MYASSSPLLIFIPNISPMKKCLLLVVLTGISLTSFSQECTNLISQSEFQQKLSQLSGKGSDEARMSTARTILSNRCFTSHQVRQMAMTFSGDVSRLQFAKMAWTSTADRKNYYDVLDAFKAPSSAFRLYHFIDKRMEPQPEPDPSAPSPYPAITYPLCDTYSGQKGCALPMADPDFDLLVAPLFGLKQDDVRMTAGRDFVMNNCISMAQFMKITSALELESNRLRFLKDQFMHIYDLENFNYASALLTNGPYKNEWLAYAASRLNNPNVPQPPPCKVSEAEFDQIFQTLDKEISGQTRLNMAKQIISAKKCFLVSQLKPLMGLMSFESGKLELAKYAYAYCSDPGNYYQLTEALSFSSSKEELLNFIKGKK